MTGSVLDELKDLLASNPGRSPVTLSIQSESGSRLVQLGDGYRVQASDRLRREIEGLLGSDPLAKAA